MSLSVFPFVSRFFYDCLLEYLYNGCYKAFVSNSNICFIRTLASGDCYFPKRIKSFLVLAMQSNFGLDSEHFE